MKIILDTDIASAFAKVRQLRLLKSLFAKWDIAITAEIYKELLIPLEYGYNFPLEIFEEFECLSLEDRELDRYHQRLLDNPGLGKGEIEAITICEMRKYIFSAIDNKALKYAVANKVQIMPLHAILRLLWKSKNMSKDDVKKLINELEKEDNLIIVNQDGILKDSLTD